MIFIRVTVFILLFILLTVLTQIGGILLLMSIPLFRFIRSKYPKKSISRSINSFLFVGIYLIFSLAIIPLIAPMFGRVPLPVSSHPNIKPLNIMTCILNRHYVKPSLKSSIEDIAKDMDEAFPGSKIAYLDGNFPFIDEFPLIPHLSHDDGEKLDLAFFYKDATTGKQLNRMAPSFIGYGVFEDPKNGEEDYPSICADKGYWQYGFMERIIPQGKKEKMVFDENRTKTLIQLCAKHPSLGKLFLEPHLKSRLNLNYKKIRYHGCHAVRHDDHVHLQL